MMKSKYLGLVALAALPLVAGALGCGSNGSGSLGGSSATCGGVGSTGTQGEVDLAVGDDISDQVVIFLDVLANGDTQGSSPTVAPAADIVLDAVGSGIDNPEAVAFGGPDLYVGENGDSALTIFRGYATLADGAAPDVTLDATADINNVTEMLVDENDNLIVADNGDDEVLIFRNASAIVADIAPDVILNNGGSLIDSPNGVAVADDDLYVANLDNTAGNPLVAIFRDIAGQASSNAPDAALNEDTSFFDTGVGAYEVAVSESDILFVGTDPTANGGQEVYVFEGASTLATDALPDAVLFGTNAWIDTPQAIVHLPTLDGLLVANGNFNNGVCTDAPGMVGFADADNLVTGQNADVIISQDSFGLGFAFDLKTAGGALFVAGGRNNCQSPQPSSIFVTDVFIFRNAETSGVCDTSVPNIIISGTGLPSSEEYGAFSEVAFFNGMAVNQIDSGT